MSSLTCVPHAHDMFKGEHGTEYVKLPFMSSRILSNWSLIVMFDLYRLYIFNVVREISELVRHVTYGMACVKSS